MDFFKIVLFGEAERGDFRTPYFCQTLPELIDTFGEPPQESLGLHFAVQTLLYRYPLIFFRVQQEGYSHQDYLIGFDALKTYCNLPEIKAIALPGTGDQIIINLFTPICQSQKKILIVSEKDFYDFITDE